jgi:hypothetical protein
VFLDNPAQPSTRTEHLLSRALSPSGHRHRPLHVDSSDYRIREKEIKDSWRARGRHRRPSKSLSRRRSRGASMALPFRGEELSIRPRRVPVWTSSRQALSPWRARASPLPAEFYNDQEPEFRITEIVRGQASPHQGGGIPTASRGTRDSDFDQDGKGSAAASHLRGEGEQKGSYRARRIHIADISELREELSEIFSTRLSWNSRSR